jgi:hypothetical protein
MPGVLVLTILAPITPPPRPGRWLASDIRTTKTGGGTPASNASNCGGGGSQTGPRTPQAGPRTPGGGPTRRFCYPGFTIAAVHLPGGWSPTTPTGGSPPQLIPDRTIHARHYPGACFDEPAAFAPQNTTVAIGDYSRIAPHYSPNLTSRYWDSAPTTTVPDPSTRGFGELLSPLRDAIH